MDQVAKKLLSELPIQTKTYKTGYPIYEEGEGYDPLNHNLTETQ